MASNDYLDAYQSDLKTTWNQALKDEDCARVRELLMNAGEWCPSGGAQELLKEGWSEVVPASAIWKGRTALHVAARRGDVKLAEDILKFSYPLIFGDSIARKEQGRILISTDFNHLLEVTDNDYELDALGMAVVNGNKQIVDLLKKASLHCGWNPYDISHDGSEDSRGSDTNNDNKVLAKALSAVTSDVLNQLISISSAENVENIRTIAQMYKDDCDFNFIDIEVDMHLFFHFTFSTWTLSSIEDSKKIDLIATIREQIISRAGQYEKPLPEPLLDYLLVTLKDGQGRTALHVAVDSNKVARFSKATEQLPLGETDETKKNEKTWKYWNAKDSAGRTPLYRAAAKKLTLAVTDLRKDKRTEVEAKIEYEGYAWGKGLDIDKLSWKNNFRGDCVYVLKEKLNRKGFNNKGNAQAGPGPNITFVQKTSCTALHVAIIHKHEGIVEEILKRLDDDFKANGRFADSSPNCSRRYTWPVLTALQGDKKATKQHSEVTTMQLAVLVGSIPILQQLLEAEEKWKNPGYFYGSLDEDFPSFLLAAAMGNPGVIKAFLDSEQKKFKYDIKDSYDNTALHHSLKGKHVPFYPHMVDFVDCHHVYSSRWNNDVWISEWLANPQETTEVQRDVRKDPGEDRYGQRRGSINLLLEAGIDIWAKNKHRRTASPDPDAPKDFVEWWYDKVATETKEEQTKLNDAANAISVTAALVATASYVGPLQPPVGYDGGSLQVNILAVRIFVACDSLSFYFALAAIMWALLPSLPLRRESMVKELERTRTLVAYAVTCLFPSIICVLVAFAAGYIAVMPEHGLSHHGLILATTVVGGFVCLYVMFSFSKRLLKVLWDSSKGSLLSQVLKSLKDGLIKQLEPTFVARWLKQTNNVIQDIRRFLGNFIRSKFRIQET